MLLKIAGIVPSKNTNHFLYEFQIKYNKDNYNEISCNDTYINFIKEPKKTFYDPMEISF